MAISLGALFSIFLAGCPSFLSIPSIFKTGRTKGLEIIGDNADSPNTEPAIEEISIAPLSP